VAGVGGECADERDQHKEDDDATSSGTDNPSIPRPDIACCTEYRAGRRFQRDHRPSNGQPFSGATGTLRPSPTRAKTLDKDRYEVADRVADDVS
jgi:hypothetical protein